MIRFIYTLLFSFLFFNLFGQVVIPEGRYQIDESRKLIVVNQLPLSSEVSANQINFDGKIFLYESGALNPQYGVNYQVRYQGNVYSLYFTELPILNVTLPGMNIDHIIPNSDINGVIALSDPIPNTYYQSNMGIRIRGASSAEFPKKSYRVTLKNDAYSANKDASLLNLRSDRRWLLLAMWNEELKVNNKISYDLWREMHSLHYLASEPGAISTIRMVYIELFINKEYRGLYAFAEDMDRKQLKLKDQSAGGELYKGDYWGGAVTFDHVPDLPTAPIETWGGWEMKYPDWEEGNWSAFRTFTDFVKNATDSDFRNQIASKISIPSFIDYYLFLNLTKAEDNLGKNTFIAKYEEGDPYFIVPWDLDGTWGYNWKGEWEPRKTNTLTNNLYERLLELNPNQFKEKLALRWFDLRKGLFSVSSLQNRFDTQKAYLERNALYVREYLVYQENYNQHFPFYQLGQREAALTNIKDWIVSRTDHLDYYFSPMLPNEPGCNFNIAPKATPEFATQGTPVKIEAICSGTDCAGVSYQWKVGQVVASSLPMFQVNAPATYGSYSYQLSASKIGCMPKLRQVKYTVNDGGPPTSLAFSIWTAGPVGTRYKVKDIMDGDKIYIGDLPTKVNWFISLNNGQVSNPVGSNYVDHLEFRYSNPHYLNLGWGPEHIAASDGGPYGIYGREGAEDVYIGNYEMKGYAYYGEHEVANRSLKFDIISVPLPVTLTKFDLLQENNVVHLNWETSEEIQSEGFEVEHSMNASDWVKLKTIASQNKGRQLSSYSFTHHTPGDGWNYYRLKMLEQNGTSDYSGIRKIEMVLEEKEQLYVYPNPVSDHLYFNSPSEVIFVQILTNSGTVLKKLVGDFGSGISLKDFGTGMYILQITNQSGYTTVRNLVVE
jgi:spore coat protein H